VDYDRTLQHFTAYDALRGKAVCHGYALLAFEMYRALGYEVRIISGGNHAWNLIQVGGNWYHVDTTFDDPTYEFQGHFTSEEKRRIAGKIQRDYLLQDDETMRRSGHVWDQKAFPSAPVAWPVKKSKE
jgi:transglutaminase/protease-like cytokinesis protein 3